MSNLYEFNSGNHIGLLDEIEDALYLNKKVVLPICTVPVYIEEIEMKQDFGSGYNVKVYYRFGNG